MYKTNLKKLENLNQIIRDEYNANQLAFAALEEKLRKTQVFPIFWLTNSNGLIWLSAIV